MRPTAPLLLAPLALVLGLAPLACSKDDTASATTSTTAKAGTTASTTASGSPGGGSAATVRYDQGIQAELIAVGCYQSAEDGVIGPETDAAIVAFQRAEGLAADGELGPTTGEALKAASSEGRRVCDGETTTTAIPPTTAKPTTTAAGGGSAPCTATALLGGLPAEGEKIGTYVCSRGWAAGALTDGTRFILQSQNGQWYAASQDPCGSASAGLDPVILEDGCPRS